MLVLIFPRVMYGFGPGEDFGEVWVNGVRNLGQLGIKAREGVQGEQNNKI